MTIKQLVSVGVPTYNEENYIKDCLQSIVADAYPHKEIIISDNRSNDSTWRIIEQFKKDYDDLYDIHIVQQRENKGSAYNFHYVLQKARGEFFVWTGAHDVWGRNFVKECVAILEKNQHAALVMPLVKWIDDRANVLERSHCVIDTKSAGSPAERTLLLINQWKECTIIYGLHRRSVLLNTLPWPRTLSNDNLALVRIAKQGDIIPVESTCYFRRARAPELANARIDRQLRAMNVKGMAYKRPHTMYLLHLFLEVLFIKGSVRFRTRLLFNAFSRASMQRVLLEFFPSAYNTVRRMKLRLSK